MIQDVTLLALNMKEGTTNRNSALEAIKSKEIYSPVEPPERARPVDTMILAQ